MRKQLGGKQTYNTRKATQTDLSHLIHEAGTVGTCLCAFAYSSRMDIPICTKLGMIISRYQEEKIGRPKLQERCPEFNSR
jgi:hypothetical protein